LSRRFCLLLALLASCARARSVPPAVKALTVLIEWPATVSGIPPSREVTALTAALPESIARELEAQGLSVARIQSEPHDLTARATLELEQEMQIDPFTTRPVKGRYRGVARLAFVAKDGTSGSVAIDLRDQRLDFLAATAGPPLAKALARSEEVLAVSIKRCRTLSDRSDACPASTSSAR
jgi:GTP cyclohydrolase FolE2